MRWLAAIGCLVAAGSARADHSSLHATASGDVAATDNVFAVGSGAQADAFAQVRPGLLFAYDAPRMIQELTAEVELIEYLLHSDTPSVTFQGGWRGFFLPGPRSEVLLSANASTGQLTALTTRTSPDQTTASVTPAGRTDVRQADASEYLSWVSGKESRASQTAFVRWTATTDTLMPPTTTQSFEAGTLGGLEGTIKHETFALEAGGSFLHLERIVPIGDPMGSRLDQQINPRASLVWRHDINKQWSSNLEGGVVYVNPVGTDPHNPTDVRKPALFPIFGGVLAYTESWGRATLSAGRAVTPNLLIAQNTVDDSVIAQVAMPLPWLDDNSHLRLPKLVGLGSAGVERTQLLDPTSGTLQGRFDLAHVDAGIAWTPRPGQTYGVRYEFVYQHGDALAQLVTASFVRNTLYFTFSLRYPDRVAATVPRRTESVRSDRKDLAPVGAEPVVPDPTEALPEGDDSDSR